ncbi:MAG: putative signal transduction protein [Solidesulfovibrio magneticus str. Maddingley MBC34]|uniref:Putative signal transduction protein n=1 Tax=Solidesulfovibrio magneticus str. Maddingley MBC34 TaxID=1206767 RepID=K6H780_9BACT|nr:MAG: putative signal transduction protein [Solidesulfovibrio magneticus str. Maddingley MBC34]
MGKRNIDDITPGMTLGQSVSASDGRVLAAAGTTLSEDHLRLLRAYGVRDADIVGQDGDPAADAAEAYAATAERCRELLRRRFLAMDRESAAGRTIFELAVSRAAARVQGEGLDLDALATSPALPCLAPERQLFDAAATDPASLVSGDVELATLPEVHVRLLDALGKDETGPAELAAIIGRDPSLTARLLRLVNSPVYGLRGPVDSISRAVTMVGQKELSTLVTGLAAVSAFADIAPELCDMRMFWRHAAACGVYASLLARSVPGLAPDRGFVGGLLHDLGQLVILRKLPAAAGRALILSRVEGLPASEAETAVLGFDHAAVGRTLLAGWNFPPALVAMAGDHHHPDGAPGSRETALIHVADILAQAWDWPAFSGPPTPALSETAWHSLGLPESVLAEAARDGDAAIAEIESVFFSGPAGRAH